MHLFVVVVVIVLVHAEERLVILGVLVRVLFIIRPPLIKQMDRKHKNGTDSKKQI